MSSSPRIPNLQQVTDQGAPEWAAPGRIPTAATKVLPDGGSQQDSTVAYVNPDASRINVLQPGLYTKPVAAHEATHIFQDSRNGDFQRASYYVPRVGANNYDYGGVAGLEQHPLKSIGEYNPEQQATMVEDLTDAQARLHPGMSRAELQNWDRTKAALERPIRQLQAVPPPDTSLAGRFDEAIAERQLGKYIDHPLTRLKGLFSPPAMPTIPDAPPEAPSVALGFANRSKLVR